MPLTEWLANRLGAAGVKLFKSKKDVGSIVKDALGRYREERFAFNAVENKTMPLIEEFAQSKLDAWTSYSKFFRVYREIDNKPKRITYASHGDIYMGLADIERLEEVGKLVRNLKAHKLNKMGTGILTAIALHGGAVTLQEEEEKLLDSDTGKKKSILENLIETPINSTLLGELDERATLKAILCLPRIMKDQELMTEEKLKDLSKDEAFRIKTILDSRSLDLADARGKLERLNKMLEIVIERFNLMRDLVTENLKELEKIVKKHSDYKQFSKEDVNVFAYTLVLGVFIRKIARVDLVLANGSISVLNNADVHAVLEETMDLLPQEEQYALPDGQKPTKLEVNKASANIQKELKKLKKDMDDEKVSKAKAERYAKAMKK